MYFDVALLITGWKFHHETFKIMDPDNIYIFITYRASQLIVVTMLLTVLLCLSPSLLESQCRRTSPDLATQHLDTLKHICQTHSRSVCMHLCVFVCLRVLLRLTCLFFLLFVVPEPLYFLKGTAFCGLKNALRPAVGMRKNVVFCSVEVQMTQKIV